MPLFEIIELTQNIGFRVDAQWGFFLTVHIALFGGIIYVDRPLRKTEKIVAIGLYSGFAVVNYVMLANQLELLKVMYGEITTRFGSDSSALVQYYVERSQADWFSKADSYSLVVHSLMMVIVVLTVIYDKKR
ncbi:MAG: hypothetical protein ACR2QG_12600 [Gammaproteobacteria bacterium]